MPDIPTLLSSAVVSTGLIGLASVVLRSWITDTIKFQYDQKLGTFRAELTRLSEDRTRKLESLLRHYERQVEEFYGPLWNMIHQLYVCNDLKSKLIPNLSDGDAAKVEQYYQNTYFISLHDEIRQIIKTKLYLIEGANMPASFYGYLEHALQERDQRELYRQCHVDTSFLPGACWPDGFHDDIKNGFNAAMKRYEECLEGLKA